MHGTVCRWPTHWIATTVCGVFIQTYILREKSKVLQPCTVYILKKKTKVLYVFITLIIVIKSLPFLICGLGNFVCFSCLGVSFVFSFSFFFCFVLFSWLKRKKKKNNNKPLLLVFVLLLVRTQNAQVLEGRRAPPCSISHGRAEGCLGLVCSPGHESPCAAGA